MRALRFAAVGLFVYVLAVPFAAAGQEPLAPQLVAESSAAQPLPTLRGLIVQRLDQTKGLRSEDGVQLKEAVFSRGEIRLTGTVASTEQRERVARAVEAMRGELESTLDLKIKSVDVSGLVVAPKAEPQRQAAEPRQPAPTTTPRAVPQQFPITAGVPGVGCSITTPYGWPQFPMTGPCVPMAYPIYGDMLPLFCPPMSCCPEIPLSVGGANAFTPHVQQPQHHWKWH
jgi:hypothetical protein